MNWCSSTSKQFFQMVCKIHHALLRGKRVLKADWDVATKKMTLET